MKCNANQFHHIVYNELQKLQLATQEVLEKWWDFKIKQN